MKKIIISIAFLLFGNIAYAQTINNANVNLQGANQYVSITQSGAGHTANFSLSGDSISVIASQSGQTPQSFSLSVTCGISCPNSPYIINQY
jgi:uncharacterized protein YxeA